MTTLYRGHVHIKRRVSPREQTSNEALRPIFREAEQAWYVKDENETWTVFDKTLKTIFKTAAGEIAKETNEGLDQLDRGEGITLEQLKDELNRG